MVCTKCGYQNAEGVKFCTSCGNNLQEAPSGEINDVVVPPPQPTTPPPPPPVNVQASGSYTPPPMQTYNAPPQPKGMNPLVIILPIAFILIAAVAVVALMLTGVIDFGRSSQSSSYVDDRDRDRERDDNRDRSEEIDRAEETQPSEGTGKGERLPDPLPEASPIITHSAEIPRTGGSLYVNGTTEFTFTPNETGMWEFRTSNNEGDPYLYLYNSFGDELAYDDDGADGYNALIMYNLTAGETYRINATFFGSGTGSYTLNVSQVIINSEEIPRNGGTVYVSGETNFMFTPSTTGIWEFRTSNNDGDPVLRLFNSSGIEIAYDDDGGGGLNSLIRHHVTAGESYVINANFYGSNSGHYSLSVSPYVINTGEIPSGGGSVTVSVETDFTFVPSTSGIWEFRTSNNDGDPYLYLFSSNGTELAYDDDGGDGVNALIMYNLTAGETYRINANFYSGGTGSYTLTVTQSGSGDVTDNSLVGYWEWSSGTEIYYFAMQYFDDIQFFADGTVIEYGWNETGIYTVLGDGRLRVVAEESGTRDFTYTISGNMLTITDSDGDRATWRRR